VVVPLPDRTSEEDIIPKYDIPLLNLEEENVIEPSEKSYIEHPSRKMSLPRSFTKESSSNAPINRTQCRKVFKPRNLKQKDLKQ